MFTVSTKSVKIKERLYLIEFRDGDDYFIKCGKASGNNSESRLFSIMESFISSHRYCVYAKIIRDVEVDDVFKKEGKFHNMFADRRYIPKHQFSGYTELFALDKEEAILAFDKIVSEIADTSLTKVCKICSAVLPTSFFGTNSGNKDKLSTVCKKCTSDKARSYTELPRRIYNNQVLHSKTRGHPAPAYTYEDFSKWIFSQSNYKMLHDTYKNNGYAFADVPSVDRLDPSKGYSFANIELVSFAENLARNGKEKLKNKGKPVLVIDKFTGKVIGEFCGRNEAATAVGVSGKKMHRKVDLVLKNGRLAAIGDYQFVSKTLLNKFIRNGALKDCYRWVATKLNIRSSQTKKSEVEV
jgi:hypothetical protein